jgi:putative ABC transport system ATP-binding protein
MKEGRAPGARTGAHPAVRLTGVGKAFASGTTMSRVLDDVDLSIGGGEIVAVSGPSGSGKTTLLGLVVGWQQPDAGTVVVLDGLRAPGAHRWDEVAILPQSLGLLDELTILENVTLPLRLHDGPHADPAVLLRRLGIAHLGDRFPTDVSLGEQQRAALARAVIVAPRVLVADEPVAHQDRARAEIMMALLRDLTATGTSCLLATHDDVAFAAADRVVNLHDGRVSAASGPH